jgi:hypothetical protein
LVEAARVSVTATPFAPVGELLAVDGGERVVCHVCGRALAMLGATHLRKHGWTADAYREAFGLRRGASLCAPAVTERRRQLGLERYESNRRLRDGLAVGQAMARSGRLLELSHLAQPAGSARVETRRRAGERTAPVRQRTAGAAASRLEARLDVLGFAGDLGAYLRDGYVRRHLPVLALARELGVGNSRMQALLDAAGVVRRRPGGAGPARVRWAAPAAAADAPPSD